MPRPDHVLATVNNLQADDEAGMQASHIYLGVLPKRLLTSVTVEIEAT